jgi:hypothetical protein
MTVTLTSPCMGKQVGETYTGPGETWIVAMGYGINSASGDPEATGANIAYAGSFTPTPGNDNQIDYSGTIGPDGLNTLADGGEATAVLEVDDLSNPANREDPRWPADEGEFDGMANDAANLNDLTFPHTPDYDMGGVDNDAPSNLTLSPDEGPAAGGTVVTISGDNLVGVSAVSFGGTPGVALDTDNAETSGEITVTTPAHAAGAVNVVLTDASGNATMTNAFTYTA